VAAPDAAVASPTTAASTPAASDRVALLTGSD
jgi:hypothetical protein